MTPLILARKILYARLSTNNCLTSEIKAKIEALNDAEFQNVNTGTGYLFFNKLLTLPYFLNLLAYPENAAQLSQIIHTLTEANLLDSHYNLILEKINFAREFNFAISMLETFNKLTADNLNAFIQHPTHAANMTNTLYWLYNYKMLTEDKILLVTKYPNASQYLYNALCNLLEITSDSVAMVFHKHCLPHRLFQSQDKQFTDNTQPTPLQSSLLRGFCSSAETPHSFNRG